MHTLYQQLLRSGTSIGANIEEALAGFSRNDFIYKMNIALKECHESHYWIRLVKDSNILNTQEVDIVLSLCGEIKKILTSIIKTS